MRIRLAIIFAVLLVILSVAIVFVAPAPVWSTGAAVAALVLAWLTVDAMVLRPLASVARQARGHTTGPSDGGLQVPEPNAPGSSAYASEDIRADTTSPAGEGKRGGFSRSSTASPIRRRGPTDDLRTIAQAFETFQDLLRTREIHLRMADEKHEETVKAFEARYRELFDANPHPMIVFDTENLEILAANELAVLRYGYTQHQFLRMTVRHLLADAVTCDNNTVIARIGLFGSGPVHDCHRRRDGSIIAVEVACSRMRYGGRPAAVALFADITERTRLEAENRRHTETLEALYTSARNTAESLSVHDVALTVVGDAVRRFGMLGAWLARVGAAGAIEPLAAFGQDDESPRMLSASSDQSPGEQDEGPETPSWSAIRERAAVEYDPKVEKNHYHRFGIAVPDSGCYGLAVPLVSRDEVFGVLHVLAPEPNASGRASLSMADVASAAKPSRTETGTTLTSFALFAGAALMNAQLHEELQRNADRLDGMVRERTRELEAANKELEAFSYSVSHDLRAPLRTIDGFTRLTLLQYGNDMDPQCRMLLNSVRCGVNEMSTLITSLLAFSRSARQPLHVSLVSVSDTVDAVIQSLRPETHGRKIEWVVGSLPDCMADPVLLKQVYVNLLSNAVKFTSKRAEARIEVGADVGAETVYYVKDNGAGFDQARAKNLFGVFQRFHRAEDFPGTGVGLATVQRVIYRHGGRIWCDAAPDQGASFYFTLQEHRDG
mgnify:CR=1 FL=1